jgi:hypothetical protein
MKKYCTWEVQYSPTITRGADSNPDPKIFLKLMSDIGMGSDVDIGTLPMLE